jgi:predicted transposase YbfD/YdcC
VQGRLRRAPPPFASERLTEKGNGRITARQSRAWPLEDPAEAGIVHCRTLVVTERQSFELKTRRTTSETVYHLSTEECAARTGAQWAGLVRGHWGIEARNHGRRDACLLEDKTRSKNAHIVANFCVARAALLYFNAQTATGNVNAFSEECRESKQMALGLITRRRKVK